MSGRGNGMCRSLMTTKPLHSWDTRSPGGQVLVKICRCLFYLTQLVFALSQLFPINRIRETCLAVDDGHTALLPTAEELHEHLDSTRVTAEDLIVSLLNTSKLRGSVATVYHYGPDFQVVRFDWPNNSRAKEIRPIHQEGEFWVMGDPKCGKLPLYHVNDLRKATTIHVSEGEKTTDILRALGLDATTSSHGSNSARRSDWTPLADKNVVILPDAGKTGMAYAKAVVGLLSKLTPVPTIRVVTLPGLGDGEDVEQWLASLSGGTDAVEALAELVDGTESARTAKASLNGPYTELWLSEKFVDQHGDDVRFCLPLGWLYWSRGRWKRDQTGEIQRRVKRTVRDLYIEAAGIDSEARRSWLLEFARKSERNARIMAVVSLAKSERPVPVSVDDLDADGWLLNTPRETIDLRTGQPRKHRRTDMLTKRTAVACDQWGKAPRWTAFLDDIFKGDEELTGFVQRALGAAIAGVVRDHVLHILHGVGANGKSTLVETVKAILGNYATMSAPNLLMRKHDTHPTELADLRGMRLVATAESGEGRRLDEERVKCVTGDDTIRARYMYGDFFEFPPTHTLLIATNHRPEIKGRDLAIWRRIRLGPFTVVLEPAKQDAELKAKLLEEGPAILGWLVQGCLGWQELGLDEPESVKVSTAGYRSDQDTVRRFLDECCVVNTTERTSAKVLHEAYHDWSGDRMSMQRFGARMRDIGYETTDRSTGGRKFWIGIRLPDEHDEASLYK